MTEVVYRQRRGRDQHYTTAELAHSLQVSESTIKRLLRDGEIVSVKIAGCRRVSPGELKEYLDRRTKEAEA